MSESTNQVRHPKKSESGYDLDAQGDLTLNVRVTNAQSVVLAANSQDNANWSASVEWQDGTGNTYVTESKTDIALDTVDNDWSRLVRKGPRCVVTFTDESGGTNRLNAFLDTHR